MPSVTVKALKVTEPGNSLAAWLAAHHPDLFLAAYKQARAAHMKKGIRKLGLLGDDGVTTFFGDGGDVVGDVSPALESVSFPEPGLTDVSFDPGSFSLPSDFLSDVSDSSGFLSSIGNGLTSAGSTVGDVLTSGGSSVLSALGSVGSWIPTGINELSSLAKVYFGSQAATAAAQTQRQVTQAQINRAATQQAAAPITYMPNAQGQLVPVYATQTPGGTVYQPLSPQGIASLTPSSVSVFLSQYGLYIAAAAVALFGFTLWSRSRG